MCIVGISVYIQCMVCIIMCIHNNFHNPRFVDTLMIILLLYVEAHIFILETLKKFIIV